MAPNPTPSPLAWLCHTRAFVHVREYVWIVCALGPNTMAPLTKTIMALHHFHPLVKVDLPLFVDDFHLETNFILDREAFISILTHSPSFSFNGFSGTVYELLWDYFVLDDSVNGFDFFFEICGHKALPLVSRLLVASWLLSLEEQAKGIQPIAIGEVIYQLIGHTLVIQFKDTFAKHFSPH